MSESYQSPIITPQLCAYTDTAEYQYYIKTMGNPSMKYILDTKLKNAYAKQRQIDENACKYRQRDYVDDYHRLKLVEEVSCSSNIFNYNLTEQANKEIDEEIAKAKKENEYLQKQYQELVKICNEAGIPVD